jgi:hypothetical protein
MPVAGFAGALFAARPYKENNSAVRNSFVSCAFAICFFGANFLL